MRKVNMTALRTMLEVELANKHRELRELKNEKAAECEDRLRKLVLDKLCAEKGGDKGIKELLRGSCNTEVEVENLFREKRLLVVAVSIKSTGWNRYYSTREKLKLRGASYKLDIIYPWRACPAKVMDIAEGTEEEGYSSTDFRESARLLAAKIMLEGDDDVTAAIAQAVEAHFNAADS